MTVIDKDKKRTLRNWVSDGVITSLQAKNLIEKDKVKYADQKLVAYNDLGNFNVINNSCRFDVVWNTMYSAIV
jgi:hypothetical protein